MMFSNVFLALIFSHLVADFWLQDQTLVAKKNGKGRERLKALIKHSMIFFLVSAVNIIIAIPQGSLLILLAMVCLLALSHFIIDCVKTKIKNRSELSIFLWDQAAHIAAIVVVAAFYNKQPLTYYLSGLDSFFYGNLRLNSLFTPPQKEVLTLIFALLLIPVGNILLDKLLVPFRVSEVLDFKQRHTIKLGSYIGKVERVLTVIGIMAGAYSAVAVLYGSKTVIRYTEIAKNSEFAEYYLVGTSISALFSVLVGIAAKAIFIP